MARRALEWLVDEGLIDSEAAERAMPDDPQPSGLSGPFEPFAIAEAVATARRRDARVRADPRA
jgi:hypothetical protein